MYILPIDAFYILIHDFPREGDLIRKVAMEKIEQFNLFREMEKFKFVRSHSSRSVGPNYEESYDVTNILITSMWGTTEKKITATDLMNFNANDTRRNGVVIPAIEEMVSEGSESSDVDS
jgi:hypothetical protein